MISKKNRVVGALALLLCVANTSWSKPETIQISQQQAEEMIRVLVEDLQKQCGSFFEFLAHEGHSDEDLMKFAELTINQTNQAQQPIDKAAVIESARQIHFTLHVLGYAPCAKTIVNNLTRVAVIANSPHLKALTAYIKKNNIDLSDAMARIE